MKRLLLVCLLGIIATSADCRPLSSNESSSTVPDIKDRMQQFRDNIKQNQIPPLQEKQSEEELRKMIEQNQEQFRKGILI
ncbi:MAG TPA: hypothetical protein DCR21_07610 [Succinivibrionaceae bacterium]|nr:hypothetical protein [Succinivibrionaceae bacterium]